jgi:hypothetical protein
MRLNCMKFVRVFKIQAKHRAHGRAESKAWSPFGRTCKWIKAEQSRWRFAGARQSARGEIRPIQQAPAM